MNKRLQDLTIKSAFMFGAVMVDPELCKEFLELALEIKIARVEISKEKSIVYNPEYRGVRLDVYAADEKSTRYNVEMQAYIDPAISRRARYYHDQVDMELLLSGIGYEELPDTYVIFVCDFDPFGLEKYRYTQIKMCKEESGYELSDGAHTIFLSTKGKNKDEVPKELVNFLRYVAAPLSQSEDDFQDAYVEKLQKAVKEIKRSREMGAKYMTFEELLRDEWKAGHAKGREEGRELYLENLVQKKREQGMSIPQIAEILELTEAEVRKYYNTI